MSKKVYLKVFGCQMNMRDSEIIAGMLQQKGYALAGSAEEADILLFNTCSVRQQAEHRVWSALGRCGKGKIIGVVGCMAQNHQLEILRRVPHVSFVCGPANIYDIPKLLERMARESVRLMAVDKAQRPMRSDCGFRFNALSAYISIMYGCDNFCSYCVVPYLRGREVSRPVTHILDEARELAAQGCKEITLLGQNVNSYGKDLKGKVDFVGLLGKLNKIKGIERIRFMTSHPKDASEKLFYAIRDLPKVCEHLHLPLQAGSDRILKLMNRGYTLKQYMKLVDSLHRIVPECSLSSDIIVGFPGESKEDFRRTYQAIKDIQFDESFIFKYSSHPRTKAAQLKDDVAVSEKQRRNHELLKLQEGICLQKNKVLLGASVEVLAEGPGRCWVQDAEEQTPILQGRSRTNRITLFSGKKDLISQIVNVKIDSVTPRTLIGKTNGKKS